MKYGRQPPILPPAGVRDASQGRRAGFTIIELMVAIVVFGILSAAAVVNWSSFMRYQELRQDAHGFHKELLALKAKALADSNVIKITTSAPFTITTTERKDDEGNPLSDTQKPVSLNKKVTISAPDGRCACGTAVNNGWAEEMTIIPDNLNAFNEGCIEIANGSSKSFCIQKDGASIKPELYYKSGANGQWKRM